MTTFDAVSTGTVANGGGTTCTVSHTCSTSGNRVLIVDAIVGSESAQDGVTTTCTYDSVSMTSLGKVHSNNNSAGFVEKFYLINPSVGTHDIVFTRTTVGGNYTIIVGGKSYTDASQTAADYTGTVVSAFGSSTTPTVNRTGTATDSIVDDAACCGLAFSAVGAGQTQRFIDNENTSSAAGNAQGSTEPGNGGTVTMSHTVTSDWWAIIAVEVRTSAAPPSPDTTMAIVQAGARYE